VRADSYAYVYQYGLELAEATNFVCTIVRIGSSLVWLYEAGSRLRWTGASCTFLVQCKRHIHRAELTLGVERQDEDALGRCELFCISAYGGAHFA
jgi:hypothetical protein